MRAGYGQAFKRTTDLMPQLDDIWAGMEQLARRENISMERLGGLMAVNAVPWSKKSAGIMRAAGQTGAELFDERILDSYRPTLALVSQQGVDGYVREHMRPFLQAARSHFDSGRTTWVERKLGKATE